MKFKNRGYRDVIARGNKIYLAPSIGNKLYCIQLCYFKKRILPLMGSGREASSL